MRLATALLGAAGLVGLGLALAQASPLNDPRRSAAGTMVTDLSAQQPGRLPGARPGQARPQPGGGGGPGVFQRGRPPGAGGVAPQRIAPGAGMRFGQPRPQGGFVPRQGRPPQAGRLPGAPRPQVAPGPRTPRFAPGTPAPRYGIAPSGPRYARPRLPGATFLHGRRFTVHQGPRRISRRGIVHTLVAASVLAPIVIAGYRYYPYGYVSLVGPYCEGYTDDGCYLSWEEVPTLDGDTALQCVAFCPWP